MKQFLLIIGVIFSLTILTVGLYEIKELHLFDRYSIYYGSEGSYNITKHYAQENELYAAIFSILCFLTLLFVFWVFKKRAYLKIRSKQGINYFFKLIFQVKSLHILLMSLLFTTLLTFCYIKSQDVIEGGNPVFSRPWLFTALAVEHYPKSINSNETLHIKVNQRLSQDDFDKQKEGELTSEYEATARLQSGFIAPSSLQEWQPRKKIKLFETVEWNWILKPDLDRYGNQKILIEGSIYDKTGKMVAGAMPLLIVVDVKTPLGLPSWMAYLITFLGGVFSLAFFGWLWLFIYERYIKKEQSKETEKISQPQKSINSKQFEGANKIKQTAPKNKNQKGKDKK